MSAENRAELAEIVNSTPKTEITVDLVNKKVTAGGRSFDADIRESARLALINGKYDPLFELMEAKDGNLVPVRCTQ